MPLCWFCHGAAQFKMPFLQIFHDSCSIERFYAKLVIKRNFLLHKHLLGPSGPLPQSPDDNVQKVMSEPCTEENLGHVWS